jgi:hypothetical protein
VTRLTDLPPDQAERLAELDCPDFKLRPWMAGPALSQRRVAIVSSAGLVERGENPFRGRDLDYRAIARPARPGVAAAFRAGCGGQRSCGVAGVPIGG